MEKLERFRWFTEQDAVLRESISEMDRSCLDEKVGRLKFINEEFGPDADMLFYGGVPALISFHEMKMAYIHAIELSVIVCAHIFVEQTLGAMLIFAGFDKEAESGMASIIKRSLSEGYIDNKIAGRLDTLRKMRISYFHTHVGLKERSYMNRRISSNCYDDAELLANDSKEAIQVVVDLLRYQNPDHKPGIFEDELGN